MADKLTLWHFKDEVAIENGWVDWQCFRSDCDWSDQETIINSAAQSYANYLAGEAYEEGWKQGAINGSSPGNKINPYKQKDNEIKHDIQ